MQAEAQDKGRIVCYDTIRILATILVVIGHSCTLGINLTEGTLNPFESNVGPLVLQFSELIRKVVYSFHMPLFVCLSGSMFALSHKKKGVSWIVHRGKRLLLPYFLTAVLLLIPVRFVIGYYGVNPDFFGIFAKDFIMGYDINYLWYLQMLFGVQVLAVLLQKPFFLESKKARVVTLFVLLVPSILQFKIGQLPFQMHRICEMLFWFYVGMLFEFYRDDIGNVHKSVGIVLAFSLWLIAFCAYYSCSYVQEVVSANRILASIVTMMKMLFYYGMAFGGCVTIYIYAMGIKQKHSKINSLIKQYSFSIYLYHVPIMMLYRLTIQRIIPEHCMSTSLYSLLLILNVVVGIGGSIFIAKTLSIVKRGFIHKGVLHG